MLVWKSSKLTSGRKPNWVVEVEVSLSGTTASGPEKSSAAGAYRPKENREWLLEDEAESIGLSTVGERCALFLVGLGISLLLVLKQESPSLSATGAMRKCQRRAAQGRWKRQWCHGECCSSNRASMVRWQGSEEQLQPAVFELGRMLGMGTATCIEHTA